ncbi:hypothetical protein [Streptomyces phage phiScoe25]|nr:hypothetical protein [Streptomyces phage phiScoe25]
MITPRQLRMIIAFVVAAWFLGLATGIGAMR